jgi:hypothetical protein
MKAHQKRIMAIMEASLEEMKSVAEHHPQWKLLEHWRTYIGTGM